MPWTTPACRAKAWAEQCAKYERIPDPAPKPYYDPPMSIFNNRKSYASFVPYDLLFHFEEGFDIRARRDDRKALLPQFENIFREEERKFIPITTQLWYGRPVLLENPLDTLPRRAKINSTKDFYRTQGVNMAPGLEREPMH